MATIVNLFGQPEPDGADASILAPKSPTDQAAELLRLELPRLLNDAVMLVGKPMRLVFDPTADTASTDCVGVVFISPAFFIRADRPDLRRVGYGTLYHEAGHINHSPYGMKLLGRARKEGGEFLAGIVNIMLDRKDDLLTARRATGFAEILRARLAYICTMQRRKTFESRFPDLSPGEIGVMLRKVPAKDAYEDFFYAAKWHRAPRFKESHRAVHLLTQKRLLAMTPDDLLETAIKIRAILAESRPDEEQRSAERQFMMMVALATAISTGIDISNIDPDLLSAISKILKGHVARYRHSELRSLIRILQAAHLEYPGAISTGKTDKVPVVKVPQDSKYAQAYGRYRESVVDQVEPLVRKLRQIDTPSTFEIYGQDDGELDLSEVARIATGLNGYHKEEVVERDIDAEIHLAIDFSGSMQGEKVEIAKRIGTVFNEAIMALNPSCIGRLWGYNSESIRDFGPPSSHSGFVQLEGSAGNSDTHMLIAVGNNLLRSQKRRKILLVLCDDGPDNVKEAKQISQQLAARGLPVVHLLVGVHATPQIFPVELLYTSMDECLAEFGTLIETIIKNLR